MLRARKTKTAHLGGSTPPRVLLAGSTLCAGGAERVLSELANAWAKQGWQIGIMTISGKSTDHYLLHPSVDRITLDLLWDSHSVWQSFRGNLRRSRAIRKAVLQFAPDVVLSFIEQTNIRLLTALLGTAVPIIVSERTDPRRHEIGRAWRLARRLVYPFARTVVVQTDAVANWAKSFLPARNVQVIPNFVRLMPLAPNCEERNENEILAVGRLGREKGFDLLLHAFAACRNINPEMRLTILGEGAERASLRALALELDIAEAVDMPGVVKDPERWMARCAVFVLPSRYEGFPNALLEAMAMGCAVLAADCDSGPRELIYHGKNGLLVLPENVDDMARELGRLMGDRELRRKLGEAAVAVRRNFSRDSILIRWEELIMDSLGARTK